MLIIIEPQGCHLWVKKVSLNKNFSTSYIKLAYVGQGLWGIKKYLANTNKKKMLFMPKFLKMPN